MSLRKLLVVFGLLLSVSGCTGITPEGNLRDHREEGPKAGLLSGSDGEFVIVGPGPAGRPMEDGQNEESEAGK